MITLNPSAPSCAFSQQIFHYTPFLPGSTSLHLSLWQTTFPSPLITAPLLRKKGRKKGNVWHKAKKTQGAVKLRGPQVSQ